MKGGFTKLTKKKCIEQEDVQGLKVLPGLNILSAALEDKESPLEQNVYFAEVR